MACVFRLDFRFVNLEGLLRVNEPAEAGSDRHNLGAEGMK